MSLRITDVKLLSKGRLLEGTISIDNGRITRIGRTALLPKSERTIDGRGLIALPGLIDAHVHLRDMELEYKEDFRSGTLSAAAGGFTTVLDMPNTRPPTNSDERIFEKMAKARGSIHVNVGFHAALAESAVDLRRMKNAGAVAFKLYMNEPNPDAWHNDHRRLLSSLEECKSLGVCVAVHAENGPAISKIQGECQSAGKSRMRDFLRAHAPRFEVDAIRTISQLARRSRSKIHVCHVSTYQGLGEIFAARRRGMAVTCEVTPHHMFLDQTDMTRRGGIAVMVPPLRSPRDARSLWNSVAGGRVDIVASDHAPHTIEEKTAEDAWAVRPGIPGLETTLPLLLTKLHHGQIGLSRIVELLARGPARIFGLERKGRLAVGMDADLVLIDPKERFRIVSKKFYSKAHFSPFDGVECTGRPVLTMVVGHVVYDRGEIVEAHNGKILTQGAGP